MKKVLLLLIMLVLIGCKKNDDNIKETLESPVNITHVGSLLSWDKVENATKYQVTINENTYYTSFNYYEIVEEGSYEVVIIAMNPNYHDSLPSEKYSFVIDYMNEVTFDLVIDKETQSISWNDIDEVSSYKVYINGNIYETIVPEFSYSNLTNGLLHIRVQGIYPLGETNLSNDIYIEHNIGDEVIINYQYSRNSSKNLLILNNTFSQYLIFDEDNRVINSELLIEANENLEIKSDYLLGITDSKFTFYIYSGNVKAKVTITFNNKTTPYIISGSTSIYKQDEDISFQFELFDESFKQLSSNGLKTSDYVIDNDVITFKSSFLNSEFENKDLIQITYVIDGDDLVVGLISIYKQ